MGGAIRGSSSGKRLGKSSKLGMFFSFLQRVILVCECGRYQNGKKDTLDPMWKLLKEVDLGERTSFNDLVSFVRETETS